MIPDTATLISVDEKQTKGKSNTQLPFTQDSATEIFWVVHVTPEFGLV